MYEDESAGQCIAVPRGRAVAEDARASTRTVSERWMSRACAHMVDRKEEEEGYKPVADAIILNAVSLITISA